MECEMKNESTVEREERERDREKRRERETERKGERERNREREREREREGEKDRGKGRERCCPLVLQKAIFHNAVCLSISSCELSLTSSSSLHPSLITVSLLQGFETVQISVTQLNEKG